MIFPLPRTTERNPTELLAPVAAKQQIWGTRSAGSEGGLMSEVLFVQAAAIATEEVEKKEL